MSKNIETTIQASKFPAYIQENHSVISLTKDVSLLFTRLLNYGISLGADIETNRETGSFKMVYWKNAEYTNIEVTIYSGTLQDQESDRLTVEYNRLSGSRSLFLEVYCFVISSGNSEGIFNAATPRISLLRPQDFCSKEPIFVTENYLETIFNMIDSDYVDIKISGGNIILKIFVDASEDDKMLILKHPKIAKFLESMMATKDQNCPDLLCATIAMTFASEAKLNISTEEIDRQHGIMWKEAQRQARRLQGKL
jgi:hypothetical protein